MDGVPRYVAQTVRAVIDEFLVRERRDYGFGGVWDGTKRTAQRGGFP
jgi:hypothetical protein